MAKFDALTFSGTAPAIYFDEAPQVDSSGAEQRIPYCILRDDGLQPEYQSSHGGIEVGSLTLEIYGTTLASADAIAAVVKWNGSAPSAAAGLDFCMLAVDPPLYFVSLIRTDERRSYAGFSHQNQRCHKIEMVWSITTELRASG